MLRWFGEPAELRYIQDRRVRARYLSQALSRFQKKYAARSAFGRNALFLSLFLTPAVALRGSLSADIIIVAMLWSVGCWLYWRLNRERLRCCLREVILDNSEVCTSCGYHKQGNVSGVCPECGDSLMPLGKIPDRH